MENYENKYKEALEKARQLCVYPTTKPFISDLQDLFPELKKDKGSDDERIRKEIVSAINIYCSEYHRGTKVRNDMLAWVEKQGEQKSIDNLTPQEAMDIAVAKCFDEQKPDDKVEPKFHKGDWTVSKLDRKARQISEVHFDEYNSYYVVEGKSVNLEEYDRLHHLWTFKDAKDGDVLVDRYGNIGIFEKTFGFDWHSYCYLGCNGDFMYNEIGGSHDLVDTYPATKEQRGLLFQKIKKAGYEWDANKKELRKIEQNPADKIEPTFNVGDKIQYSKGYGTIMTIEKIENGEYIFSNNMGHTTIESGNKWYLVNPVEQKPAWSEEDASLCVKIQGILSVCKSHSLLSPDLCKEMCDWLKSLNDKMRPKQKWSEEDEKHLKLAIDNFQTLGNSFLTSWLNSLKNRVQQKQE